MPDRQPSFLVNPYSEPVLVKVNQRASFQNAGPLKDFLEHMIVDGRRHILLDFVDCTSMDSTFLGILAGAALRLRECEPPGELILTRLNERNLELVQNLGLPRILRIESFDRPPATATEEALPQAGRATEDEQARLVLQAHETLINVDAQNRAKFQDVVSFLRNQLNQG